MFFGSKLEVLKLLPVEDVESPVSPLISLSKQKEIFSKRKEKLGPIYLDISNNHRLYESWDEAF
jgi:acyl carrier protein phosphodiesterase